MNAKGASSFESPASAQACRSGAIEARTASIVSASKPGRPSIEPSMRKTFQPGRVSPRGFATAWNDCTRPSMFTNVPAVSAEGAMGRITCAYSGAQQRHAVSATTKSACLSAAIAAGASAASRSGSKPATIQALRGSAIMARVSMPPGAGHAPTSFAPTLLAFCAGSPSFAPVRRAISPAMAASAAKSGCCCA